MPILFYRFDKDDMFHKFENCFNHEYILITGGPMKKRNFIFPAIVLSAFLLFQGCAGTPETEPVEPVDQPEPTVEETEDIEAPEKERDQAVSLRSIVMETEPDMSDTESFLLAEEAFNSAELAYGSDNLEARKLYIDAIDGYKNILDSTYGERVKQSRSVSLTEKEAADTLFASKAAPDAYAEAEASLEEAELLSKAYKYPSAIGAYQSAEASFRESAEIAQEKKNAAMKALEEAQATYNRTEEELKEEETRLNSERNETEKETREEYESADIELEEEETE